MQMSAFVPSTVIPLIFGGVVACGFPGDELTGQVDLPLQTTGSMAMNFSIPAGQSRIEIALCMRQVGSPTAPVLVTLYDSTGTDLLATGTFSPKQVPTSAGWTDFITLTPVSPLAGGYYQIVVSSPASTSGDFYLIYINLYTSFVDPNATASYTPPPGLSGNAGSPVVWVKDGSGNDLTIFPFGISGDTSLVGNGTFVAASSYQINCLVPWCVPPSQDVIANPSVKPISEIRPGDKVLSHNGNFEEVERVYSRHYEGKMVKVFVRQSSLPIVSTPEHPIYAIRRRISRKTGRLTRSGLLSDEPQWIPAIEIVAGDIVVVPRIMKESDIRSIRVSDYLNGRVTSDGSFYQPRIYKNGTEAMPAKTKPIKNEIGLTDGFYSLVGYYLAEGNIARKNGRVGGLNFTFNINEQEYVEDVTQLLKELFAVDAKAVRRPAKGTVEIRVDSALLGRLFAVLFGLGARNKDIPHWMLYSNRDKQKALIRCYWRGDGSRSPFGYRMTSVSKQLSYKVQLLLERLGFLTGTYYDKRKKAFEVHVQGQPEMADLLREQWPALSRRRNTYGWVSDTHVFRLVRKVERDDYSGPVFNLKVKNSESFSFPQAATHNCSDMEYMLPPYSASFTLTDTTTGIVLGTAPATQYYNSHGITGLVPLQLPGPVSIVAGHSYKISISESGNAGATSAYLVLIRGCKINPAKAGPSGSSVYWLGELALSDFSQYRVLDYVSTTTTLQDGHGGIGGSDEIAVRIVPNFTETITQVKLKMNNAQGAAPVSGYYPSGTPVLIALYLSDESAPAPEFANPTGSAIATATVDSGILPLVGFWSATVSFPVTAGTPYWIVWSAPTASTSAYDCERCVSPFRNLALGTTDSGSSWSFFSQGPTDLAFGAITSQEMLGSPYDNTVETSISTTDLVAQPFTLSQSAMVNSIFVFALGGIVTAAIYPDDGSGTGADMASPMGSGNFNTAFQYFYSGIIIPVTTSVAVQANTKYWIVFSSPNGSAIIIATYWTRPSDPSVPSGFEALVSSNGGASWGAAASEVASAIFMVGIQPSGIVVPTATSISGVLASKGINTYSLVAFGQPSVSPSEISYYLSQGFKVYPWQDGSDGYTPNLLTILEGFSAGGGGVLGPTYGWGYATQFYDLGRGYLATLYPNEQEYYLASGALSPAQSYGYNGIVIDAPELVTEWLWMYSQIDANVGLENLLGIAGWVNADHPVNYGGAEGASGGHNMNTYVRYVNSPLGLYLNDVTSSGLHNSDNTPCLLWSLIGATADYTPSTCEPAVTMATDVQSYHHGGLTVTETSSFSVYMAASNANLEYQLLAAVQAKTQAFARTAMPLSVLRLVPNYYSSVLEVTSSSIYDPSAGQVLLGSGGAITCCPYFNFANPNDNSSNPGRSGYYEAATAPTVLNFWTGIVPTFAHYPIMEADTDPGSIQAQVEATSWNHFASLYSNMPYVGGFFGYEQDAIKALVIDHSYGDLSTWSGLCAICHLWGADSYSSISGQTLSNFDVVVGIPDGNEDPDNTADLALLESYVSAGGNLILYTSSGAPSSLTGIGTTAVAIPYGHPITRPYAEADLNAALPKGYGYINNYGSGKVITLYASYYGDGFGVGDSSNGDGSSDGLSSGLAYLTLNAVLWAGGQPTPALYLPRYVQRTDWAAPLNSNGEGGSPPVVISVCGTPSGSKLIWFSNTNAATENIQLGLSRAFFATPGSWQANDANSQAVVASGSGDVVLDVTIPVQDWMPLYLQPSQTSPTRVIIVE